MAIPVKVEMTCYRKILKVSPFMYKPLQNNISPQTRNAKNPPLNHPSKYKPPPGACTWKLLSNIKSNKAKMVKFTSNYTASPINFETQISLCRQAPPKISPSKKGLWKISAPGLFSEFYGSLVRIWNNSMWAVFTACCLLLLCRNLKMN